MDADPFFADPGGASGEAASVAVLAFANMSPDAENEYFADGIAEELLNVLARIDGLRVASRTSAFSFKGKDTPIPEIARLLDVRHVLEGSVRKQGQRVRITAQLIDSETDGHVWSQTYDRELADIFAVQEEIAQAIAGELEGRLGRQQVTVVAATSQLDAYEMFLRGRVRFHQRRELDAAIADLQAAVARDPQFAEAWVYLAAAQSVKPGYEVDPDHAAAAAAASATLEQARRLAPQHPLVLGVQAHLLERQGDQVGSLDRLGEAAQLSTQDSTAVMWFGSQLLYAGYIDEAREALERAERMDPRVGINLGFLAIAYLSTDQLERAEDKARQALELGWPYAEYTLALELAARGDLERAVPPLRRSLQAMGGDNIRLLPALEAALADPARQEAYWALRARSSFADDSSEESIAMHRPEILLDHLEGVRQVDRARRLPPYWMRSLWLPSSAAVREDPRLFAFAEDHGLVRLWETRGYPPGCQRVSADGGDHLDCPGMRR